MRYYRISDLLQVRRSLSHAPLLLLDRALDSRCACGSKERIRGLGVVLRATRDVCVCTLVPPTFCGIPFDLGLAALRADQDLCEQVFEQVFVKKARSGERRPFSLFVILWRERETPRVGVRNKSYRSTLRRTTAGRTNAFTTPLPRARARQSQTSTVRERARQGLRRRSRNRRRRNARRSHGCKGLGFTV